MRGKNNQTKTLFCSLIAKIPHRVSICKSNETNYTDLHSPLVEQTAVLSRYKLFHNRLRNHCNPLTDDLIVSLILPGCPPPPP